MYHQAVKKIPYYDTLTDTIMTPTVCNVMKLELFIFDAFPLADRWIVVEAERNDEFAPVKNESGDKVDSPDTARALMSAQGRRWLQAVGAVFEPIETENNIENSICEISPLLSYE
eukprot:CAMPEP_0182426722 /NCGR_PEP_ID=MMETSP1167-20130531/13253_1 /TAXON_ID=2988 /ORGANISM="Mallomonas Sp, Strain CCMP3275" /LENGTH=114 /DNA_ID=CAMNT_0024608379 /DNA_START=308 /DNA_END=649 /DNA_ORIENTATION=-